MVAVLLVLLVVVVVLLVDTSARMGSAICCGESSNYLPIEERYNASHHRTYASTSGNSNTHNRDPDPLLAYSNNNKYNYYNGRASKNNNNNNKMYSCPSCTYQHMYEFSICEMCGSHQNIQIDHVILFKQLYDNFLLQNTLPVPTQFDDNYYNSAMFKVDDVEFNNSWYEYHKKHCILRCLCSKCNLTRNKKNKNI